MNFVVLMNRKKWSTVFILFFVVLLLKEIIFSILIPIWHTPDEQAHFAQVAFFAEKGHMPYYPEDLNLEILLSERYLGTERNERGENKFTYHPEYRIEYTDKLYGKYEQEIKDLPLEYRKTMVKQEAANYPPMYYWISSIFYKLVYSADLITRVFMVRLWSIILSVLMGLIALLIGKEIFSHNILKQYTLAIFVSFQPMLSFLFAGVNSDNLLNLLFSVFIYIGILIINRGITRKILISSLIVFGLLYLTKPQFILAIPIFIMAVSLSIFLHWRINIFKKVVIVLSCFSILAVLYILLMYTNFAFIIQRYVYNQAFYPLSKNQSDLPFISFLISTIKKTIAESLPWYWGVFNWLGVVLPRDINRIINRVVILAMFGVLIRIFIVHKNRIKDNLIFVFLILTSLIYYGGIVYFDYLFTRSNGYSFGLQGRYFFPTIIPHMALLFIGLLSLVPDKYLSFKNIWIKLFGIGFIVLNFIALYTITVSYYEISTITTFLSQVSQYKPAIFKGYLLFFWMILYFIMCLMFVFSYLRLSIREEK